MTDAHPLFPTEHADDEPIEVGWIHVTRFDGGGQKWSPRLFAASELDSLETLSELYGGGSYELIARSHDRRAITGRRRYPLPGRPLPLDGGPSEERGPAPPVAVSAAGGTSDALLLALMQMMAQQQQANTQLMIAMLTKSDQSSKEHVQGMTALHDRFAQSQAMLFQKMLEAQGAGAAAGGGGMDGFMRGIEFAQEMVQGQAEAAAESGEGGGDLKELLEGVKMFASMQHQERMAQMEAMRRARGGGAPQPAPAPPKPPAGPPPNGAASP